MEDCDALFNRAVKAGAEVLRHGRDAGSVLGRSPGSFIDPYGYKWTIATHKEDLTPEEMKKRQDEWMKHFAQQPTPA